MLATLRLLRARRLNDRLATRPARASEMDRAVRLWERVVEDDPEGWEAQMGLAEALLRRGSRMGRAEDLEAAWGRFERVATRDRGVLPRVGAATARCGLAWLGRDPGALREGADACAALRRDPRVPMDVYAEVLVLEWQAATRLAILSRDPRDARRAEELARQAAGLLGEAAACHLRDSAAFVGP